MRRLLPTLVLAGLLCGSCVFQHTVEPLTVNFDQTPVVPRGKKGDTKQFTFSYVNLLWDSNGIGQIAREHGLQEVYFADLEVLSVLGIWTQRWVHVYGR
ncbi:MAG: hypothetical protein KDC87_01570 [Planctomycetes bacterium]|nr:hypothetical protein [Planctomycetota bacterium]MCB9869055.1 hypothetical protein [Planctomycetota bacterium]MCB9888014.1 hypothetical protein [Planctomycetota bacterium]